MGWGVWVAMGLCDRGRDSFMCFCCWCCGYGRGVFFDTTARLRVFGY